MLNSNWLEGCIPCFFRCPWATLQLLHRQPQKHHRQKPCHTTVARAPAVVMELPTVATKVPARAGVLATPATQQDCQSPGEQGKSLKTKWTNFGIQISRMLDTPALNGQILGSEDMESLLVTSVRMSPPFLRDSRLCHFQDRLWLAC